MGDRFFRAAVLCVLRVPQGRMRVCACVCACTCVSLCVLGWSIIFLSHVHEETVHENLMEIYICGSVVWRTQKLKQDLPAKQLNENNALGKYTHNHIA